MKKLLVPCDFSLPAQHAFASAVNLAAQEDTEVHLIHVVELPVLHDTVLMPVLSFEEALFRELDEKAKVEFTKMVKSVEAKNIHVVTRVVFGITSRMILDYAKDNAIDMIVMGTHGTSGLREVLIGSNTEKIVRGAQVPVLTVRKVLNRNEITDIVFPNGLGDKDLESLVTAVKGLQDLFHARLHIVWINTPTNFTPDRDTRERLNNFASRFMLTNYTINIYNDLYEEQGIINFAHFIGAGMIAMGTHGRKGLAHVLVGSVAEDLVNHIDLPVWTSTLNK